LGALPITAFTKRALLTAGPQFARLGAKFIVELGDAPAFHIREVELGESMHIKLSASPIRGRSTEERTY
jgi:hypothetical protein